MPPCSILAGFDSVPTPEGKSLGMADLRASFRYIAGGMIILAAVSSLYMRVDLFLQDAVWNLAGSVFAFLFGDWMYIKFVKK